MKTPPSSVRLHAPRLVALLVMLCVMSAQPLLAADDVNDLKNRLANLEKQVAELRALLNEREQETASKEEVQALKQEVRVTRAAQAEWGSYDSKVHLAGYAAATYATEDASRNNGFSGVQFSPIFHYGYKDLILLESELELEIEDSGDTDLALEYLTIDWFINDYVALVAGKFLSPLGQFQQNMHPSWINKLPTNPVGFGHGGATPLAEVGAQLRGGMVLPMFDNGALVNYALYVGNGPRLELGAHGHGDEAEAEEEDEEGEVHAEEEEEEESVIGEIATEGFINDPDGEKVFGGRIGLVPMGNLEIGFSGAIGKTALEGERDRDYEALGVDFFGRWQNLDLRGEWIRQKVDPEATSIAPDGLRWEAWYAQASYKLLQTKFELVARYSEFDSSNEIQQDRDQWAFGINYLLSSQAIAKLAYELNDAIPGVPEDEDRLLLQLAYGF